MDFTTRRARYRGILAGDKCVHPGSVFDPISARIAEDLGFEVGMFAGSIASFTVLGAPDLVVLTLTEFAQQIHRICRAGDLSLMVDADHGYGNALSVMRTVEELETAGVSALTIEDTVLPVAFGASGVQLLSVEEGTGKMKAALSAPHRPALAIAGRTSALRVSGVEDTIKRVKAYEAAGVGRHLPGRGQHPRRGVGGGRRGVGTTAAAGPPASCRTRNGWAPTASAWPCRGTCPSRRRSRRSTTP